MSGTHVVVCVGNAFRGDDGAGLAVGEALRGRLPEGVELAFCEQEPTRLIEAWQDADTAYVVDAAHSGGAPGELHRFDASDEALPVRVFRSSTHAFGVGEAIELARALGKLPRRVLVYGVEGEAFEAREGLSPVVEAAVAGAAEAVLDDVHRLRGGD
jgi:hydrogenase maturation protease